jgi:glycosyltransferase involved in cell wall biosynthesis
VPRLPAERVGVLFLHTETAPPLGADTWIQALVMRNLDRAEVDVHAACVTRRAGAPTPVAQALSGIPDLRLKPTHLGTETNDLRGWRRGLARVATLAAPLRLVDLALYVRRHGIRVLHTSSRPRDAVACVLLGRLTGARSIVHLHVGVAPWMGRGLRWALARADGLIAISEFVGRTALEAGHHGGRVFVVPNAIDAERWRPGVGRAEARAELGFSQDAPVVCTICRLIPGKGVPELLKALALVRAECPAVRLLVVGRDPVLEQPFLAGLRGLVSELGLDANVLFTGQRPDVERLLAACDVFAMPSELEPFGLVFAEAAAMELPVVALASGGTVEVVADGETGLLAPPGDDSALAERILALLRDPELRRRMGRRGRARVLELFRPQRMAEQVARVYRAVLEGPATGPRPGRER